MTLTEFLLARIAEDETVSQAARANEYLPSRDESQLRVVSPVWYSMIKVTSGRLLAENEAKRQILRLHLFSTTSEWVNPPDGSVYQEVSSECAVCGWIVDACETVRLLAQPYSDHPDYQQEWAL